MTVGDDGGLPADVETPVTDALDALNVPYRRFVHAGPVTSLEQAAAERGQRPSQVLRSLLFRLAEGAYAMVLVAGPAQVSWPALRSHVGQKRLTTATTDEVLAVTGYEIGTVAPLGLPQPVRILVDDAVLAEDELSMGSGRRGLAVVLRSADLLAALSEAELGSFTVPAESGPTT
jgi:Cys-tRNA(Pro)/Cys-tRNA(Cys) deacylase